METEHHCLANTTLGCGDPHKAECVPPSGTLEISALCLLRIPNASRQLTGETGGDGLKCTSPGPACRDTQPASQNMF